MNEYGIAEPWWSRVFAYLTEAEIKRLVNDTCVFLDALASEFEAG